MAEFDSADDEERRRRVTSPGYQAPAPVDQPPAYNPNVEGRQGGVTGNTQPPQFTPAPSSSDDIRRQLEQFSRGIQVTDQDVADVQRLNQGDTIQSRLQEFARQYERRAAPTGGNNQPSVPRSAFSDPIGGPVNDFANERFARLTNPPQGSGQQLLEDALRRMSAQFQNGGFTPTELEQFQTQAIDPLERLRTARKQQVIQNLSARNIDPNSGVGRSMLADVDRQFDALRSQQQTQLGTQAARETQSRMLQALEMLSGLASTEEGRLDRAFNYRTVPLGLADRSFNQALQLYGQANPMNLFNPAMQMAAIGQGQQSGQQSALAQLAWLLMNGGN